MIRAQLPAMTRLSALGFTNGIKRRTKTEQISVVTITTGATTSHFHSWYGHHHQVRAFIRHIVTRLCRNRGGSSSAGSCQPSLLQNPQHVILSTATPPGGAYFCNDEGSQFLSP